MIKVSLCHPLLTPASECASKVTGITQELASVVIESTVLGLDAWPQHDQRLKMNGRLKSQVYVTCVDYLVLASHHVLFPCKLQAQALVLWGKDGGLQMDHQLRFQRLCIKCGHFTADALRNILRLWQASEDEEAKTAMTCITLRNNTNSLLRIGQADTGTWPMSSLQIVNKQLSFFKNVNKQLSLFKNVNKQLSLFKNVNNQLSLFKNVNNQLSLLKNVNKQLSFF